MADTYWASGQWNANCTHCALDKPLDAFYLHSNGKPRKQCKACHQARSSKWATNNRESRNEYSRTHRNVEKSNECARQWRKNNLEYDAFRTATYRARRLNQTPIWADLSAIEEIYAKCPKGFHVDHIVPLKGKHVAGFHVAENLQYLPAIENIKKGNRYVSDLLG